MGADDIRLTGGMNQSIGRLEILRNGVWGTVCETEGSNFGPNEADLACRQLQDGVGQAKDFGPYLDGLM